MKVGAIFYPEKDWLSWVRQWSCNYSEVLSLEALIDNQSASKKRESNKQDEIASSKISTPRVSDGLDVLRQS